MDSDVKRSISRMCFEFVQQLVSKKPQILESERAFGGVYSQWNYQGMHCCLCPRDDNDSMSTLTYCQSQWSLLIRRVVKLVRDYQKRKAKETRECSNAVARLNDLVLSCQPLRYDPDVAILHTIIKWYIHSSPTHHHVDVGGGETKDNCDAEWGVINNKYYKWPLYHTRQKRGVNDGNLFADYLPKFFDGDIHENCMPLVNQIPIDILDRVDEEFEMLMTVLLPLTTMEHCIPYDGVHAMDEKDDVNELVDTEVFCCRGIKRTCICSQSYGKAKKLSFKNTPGTQGI